MNLNNDLYEADETAWLDEMVRRLKAKDYVDLDFKSLIDFLESAANGDRREVRSRLIVMLLHVLKWQRQPEQRSASWASTILEQQDELREILQSRTLRNHASKLLPDAFNQAVRRAIVETEMTRSAFPATCPYTVEALITEDYVSQDDEEGI